MTIPRSRLAAADLPRVGFVGLRTRRLRAGLSALGIAIGIASMVAVLAISESSRADLLAAIDRLGTNLLTVAPGQSFLGEDATLPKSADAMMRRADGVESVASISTVDGMTIRRSDLIPEEETGGIAVAAADTLLPRALDARMRGSRFLSEATARYPTVVLGAVAAQRLGIHEPGAQVFLGERWFTVVGVLDILPLAPEIDRSALIGFPAARAILDHPGNPTTLYVRADTERVTEVRELLAATANPEHPEEVQVSRPSDALEARAAAKATFTSLFLGLGAVALLVGGVGIANVMVISVLERRSEIGLRRALGATGRHVGAQFLTESLILAALGGLAGVILGTAVSSAYALSRDWATVVPPYALAGGLLAALVVGGLAGFYPASRAARLSPTEALRTA